MLVDELIDVALRSLDDHAGALAVVTFGDPQGIAHRTEAYAELFGWPRISATIAAGLAEDITHHGAERIGVLHIDTGDDWQVLESIDLDGAAPLMVRIRQSGLSEANMFRAIRQLEKNGYRLESFYNELIGISDDLQALMEARARRMVGGNDRAAFYVISYNAPAQFLALLESIGKAAPGLLQSGRRVLLDNSIDPQTHPAYDRLCKEYDFEIIREGNLGITGGRSRCARHFDELDGVDGMYWFEDDMLLHPPGSPSCRNGLSTHVDELARAVPAIMEREALDFLMLSFTEVFGDHHHNWAWYHIDPDLKAILFPDGTFRTQVDHTGVEEGVSYLVGNVHFDNWPSYMTRRGNREMFLTDEVSEHHEGVYMARGCALQHRGILRGASLLASPVNHRRLDPYPAEERREC